MHACMDVCMYVYMFTCILYTCIHVHLLTCTMYACMYVYMYMFEWMNEYMKDGINATHTCMYVYDYIHTCLCSCTSTCTYSYAFSFTCTYTCIYICVLDIDIMYACTYTGMHACMYALNACMFVSIRVSACARMGVGVVVSPCQCERTIILPVRAKVCVCVYPDSKIRVLAKHVLCAVVEAGGHPYHLSWMPNEEGSGW